MFLSMNDAVLSYYERSILSRVKTLEITRYVTKANKLTSQNRRENNADYFLSQFHTRVIEVIVLAVINSAKRGTLEGILRIFDFARVDSE